MLSPSSSTMASSPIWPKVELDCTPVRPKPSWWNRPLPTLPPPDRKNYPLIRHVTVFDQDNRRGSVGAAELSGEALSTLRVFELKHQRVSLPESLNESIISGLKTDIRRHRTSAGTQSSGSGCVSPMEERRKRDSAPAI
jgi:hypothetical protein